MVDVQIPTTDGRQLLLTRYTEPDLDLRLLLGKLRLELPVQPSPKISPLRSPPTPDVVKTLGGPVE